MLLKSGGVTMDARAARAASERRRESEMVLGGGSAAAERGWSTPEAVEVDVEARGESARRCGAVRTRRERESEREGTRGGRDAAKGGTDLARRRVTGARVREKARAWVLLGA